LKIRKECKAVPERYKEQRREVTVISDANFGPYLVRGETDLAAIENVIKDQLISLRDLGVLKGQVTVRCGSTKRTMTA